MSKGELEQPSHPEGPSSPTVLSGRDSGLRWQLMAQG